MAPATSLIGIKPPRKPVNYAIWVLPSIAVLLVVGCFVYIANASLDDIEARALAPEAISAAFWAHIRLVLVSTVVVVLLGVPLGIVLSRKWAKPIRPAVLAVANAGQAIPSIGVLVLLALLFGVGFDKAVIALVLYALLPVLRNTLVGLQQVDPFVIDAGRGMGMGPMRILWRIELPLAVPVMLAGIRVALILNVGVATLATYTNAGGLGDLIERGIVLNRMPILMVGSLLTIALALAVDWIAGLIETRLRPKGI
ncbi:ABC transporter permease [Leucobacter viscericola]|uniref:ABC transporter permease n=1 Tax=Leucobacter viscericola TaxID=2714935 RepID=A0A6G7XJU9_9MICO|nr:ABC transporter permease [Leucobacter viscericola]